MIRRSLLLAVGLFLVCTLAQAADPVPPSGNWKLSVPLDREGNGMLMVAFNEQDGKWIGDYLTASKELKTVPKFKSLKVKGDAVQFELTFEGKEFISFDGVLAKDGKKIAGSISVGGGPIMLTELYPTKLKRLDDPFELARETLAQAENGPLLFDAAASVLAKAGAKKLPLDDVRAILERVNKAAAGYGPRWEREVALRLADSLAGQAGMGDLAIAQAKRAEKFLTDSDDVATRIRMLEAVAKVLTKAGKPDEAKAYSMQLTTLEARDFADYTKTFPFKVEAFAGRKGKSNRTVLVELITGTECQPCVLGERAFDGLAKAYKPADAIFLEYHVPAGGLDPLTTPESMKRVEEYYGDQIRGMPPLFIAGKLVPPVGKMDVDAQKLFTTVKEQINEALEKEPGAKVTLTVGKGEKGGFTAKATVTDLENPGEKMMLRFALAEVDVRSAGGNGLRYHHMVVRAMPGGAKGFALTKKTAEQAVAFDPADLQKDLSAFIADLAKNDELAPQAVRPMVTKNLKLVAFIQNDATREVLTAVQVDVEAK